MAISYVTSADHSGSGASSYTNAFNPGATSGFLVVYVRGGSAGPTGITFNGNALTQLATSTISIGEINSLWGVKTGSTGNANVVVTFAGNQDCEMMFASWDGVDQTSPLDGTGQVAETSSSVTTLSVNTTTTIANDWIIGAIRYGAAATFTTGETERVNNGSNIAIFDTGVIASPTTHTTTATQSASFAILLTQAIVPVGGAPAGGLATRRTLQGVGI